MRDKPHSSHRIKVAYLAPIRLPSEKVHTKQVLKTCEALNQQEGITVELFVSRLQAPLERVWKEYGVRQPFVLHHISAFSTVGWGKSGYALHTLSFAPRALRAAQRKGAGLFYTRDWWIAWWLRLRRKPYVFEIHGPQDHILARGALEGARGIVAINEALAQRARDLVGNQKPIVVAHDAVDVDQFMQIPEAPPASPPYIVRYVGSVDLYDWKGVRYLLRAAELLDPARFRVEIIGATPGWIEKHQHAVPPSVRLRERVPYQAVPRLLATAHALVIPNDPDNPHGALYTSPVKLFEYMAAGRPIVASDVPAIREILPRDAAWYIDVRDAEAFARAIRDACASSEAFMRACRARAVVARHTWEARAKTIAEVLRKVV
ncbi:MAG: hypothetical protein KatS3mg100_121 [Candidatus Parcubacteria bacterium]|nr:MAG: hypothetical protein KatS3mg100_121 [Candidatus Parcubacteria bacterium]